MTIRIIGIDCAAQPGDIGIAAAEYSAGHAAVSGLWSGLSQSRMDDRLTELILSADRALIAMDAPLGWPRLLGDGLALHEAGRPLAGAADQLFTRETDRIVRARTGHRPLEVGANLIARTAKSALDLLDRLRLSTALPLPLAWSPTLKDRAAVIEVYPAATLKTHGFPHTKYKRTADGDIRSAILTHLGKRLTLPADTRLAVADADALDALVCVLAGLDFLQGHCAPPPELVQAEREGWIWLHAD